MSSPIFPSTGTKPTFNPNASYEAVEQDPVPKGKKPKFNPNVKFEAVTTEAPAVEQPRPQANTPAHYAVRNGQQVYIEADGTTTIIRDENPEQPAFKPMSDWLNIPKQGYQPIDQANIIPIDDHTVNTAKAADRVRKEIETIDPHIGNLIYDKKKELTGRINSQGLGINPKEAGPLNPQATLLESKMREDIVVHPEEIEEYKSGMAENNGMLRDAVTQKIKDLNKTDVPKANQLKADMYRIDAQDRVDSEKKIAKNVEKLQNGELEYDPRRGLLYKPEGFFPSIVTGFKQKNQLFKDYEFFTKTENESAIIKELNDRIKEQDPDTPAVVPDGALGEAGAMLGGQPIKPIVGAIGAGMATSGLGAAAAGAGIAAHEMYKLGYASELTNNYGAIKRLHPEMPDYEVYQQAKTLAEKQAGADAFTGAAMGAIGARVALKPTASLLLQKSVKSALKQIGETVAIEGLGGGAIGAGGQYIKNIMAQKAGIPVDETEGMAQQLAGGAFMTLGMAIAGKAGTILKPSTYTKLLHGLSKMPEEAISSELTRAQEVGALTPEEAQRVQTDIAEQKKIDTSIKPDVPESDRIKVQELIKKRNELEGSLETEDKAYHIDTKEKIKALNDQINSVSKGAERGELQSLVDKADKNNELFGFAAKELKDQDEKTLKASFKDISEQAHDPATEQLTIDTFGESIVNKAKELYPKEEPKQSSISVIQPGEIKQPETITIAPREQPRPVESTEKVSVIMPKTKENAIPERSAEATNVGETPGHSQEMGAGIPESGETANAQEGIGTAEEKSNTEGQEGLNPMEGGTPREVGITHRQMDAIAEELGLPTYEKSPEKVPEWDQQAAKKLQQPDALNDLFTKLRNGKLPDHVETRMMLQYMGDLMAKVEKNPYDRALQDQLLRTKDLFNIAGRIQGKALAARKGSIPVEETLPDFIMRDREANKAPLTDDQITVSKKEYEAIRAAKDAYEQKIAKENEAKIKAKAEKVIKEEASKIKKQPNKDFTSERKQILDDLKKKWDDSKGQLSATFIPYADRLIKIAPDVLRLMKSYVEQGISELPDLVKAIHASIKDQLDGISEKDVHDIIAGEYNKKKPTRSKLAQQLFDLKREAKLVNELEQLENGQAPISKQKQVQHNQKIEKLRQQIKELRDDMGLDDKTEAQKLAALKARYKNQISEIEKKISEGDYGPDEKPEPIRLDKEAQDLKDEYLKLKEDREIRLLEQEYANRTAGEKIIGGLGKALRTGRQAQSSFDVSYTYRQTIVGVARQLLALPFKKQAGKLVYTGFEKQKQLRQQLGKMYQSFGSEKIFRREMAEIKESPRFAVAQESGLNLADPNSALERFKEEGAQVSYGEQIPLVKHGIKASNRASTMIANKMKWDIFNGLVDGFEQKGRTFENSPELYKATAKYANQLVGRGFLGEKVEMASPLLGHFVYSLRLNASRLQLLTYLVNPRFYTKVPREIRIEYLKDMAKFVALSGTILSLASAAGLGIETDPRSSDFLNIKAGNTRYDVLGGFKQYFVLFSRLLSSSTKSPETGEVKELGTGFRQKSHGDVLLRFLRTKASPEAGTVTDLFVGKTFDYKDVTLKDEALRYFSPLIVNDVHSVYKDKGVLDAFMVYLLATHGVGIQTFDKDKEGESGASKNTGKQGKPGKPGKSTENTKK